ncbi:hypothetical protein HK096_000129 [Nowakowskiella sp. JEL0078]|nr:hypothetical protein HK096_000129 [Nowakowskiella sp. JEL0078]
MFRRKVNGVMAAKKAAEVFSNTTQHFEPEPVPRNPPPLLNNNKYNYNNPLMQTPQQQIDQLTGSMYVHPPNGGDLLVRDDPLLSQKNSLLQYGSPQDNFLASNQYGSLNSSHGITGGPEGSFSPNFQLPFQAPGFSPPPNELTYTMSEFLDEFVMPAGFAAALRLSMNPTGSQVKAVCIQFLNSCRVGPKDVRVADDASGGNVWISQRGLRVLNNFIEMKRRGSAAISVQKVWRGYRVRKMVDSMKRQNAPDFETHMESVRVREKKVQERKDSEREVATNEQLTLAESHEQVANGEGTEDSSNHSKKVLALKKHLLRVSSAYQEVLAKPDRNSGSNTSNKEILSSLSESYTITPTIEEGQKSQKSPAQMLGEVLSLEIPQTSDLLSLLRSGDMLCELCVCMYPNIQCQLLNKGPEFTIHKIIFFLELCKTVGLKPNMLFTVADLLLGPEDDQIGKGALTVLRTICFLERQARKKGWEGPIMYLKGEKKEKRRSKNLNSADLSSMGSFTTSLPNPIENYTSKELPIIEEPTFNISNLGLERGASVHSNGSASTIINAPSTPVHPNHAGPTFDPKTGRVSSPSGFETNLSPADVASRASLASTVKISSLDRPQQNNDHEPKATFSSTFVASEISNSFAGDNTGVSDNISTKLEVLQKQDNRQLRPISGLGGFEFTEKILGRKEVEEEKRRADEQDILRVIENVARDQTNLRLKNQQVEEKEREANEHELKVKNWNENVMMYRKRQALLTSFILSEDNYVRSLTSVASFLSQILKRCRRRTKRLSQRISSTLETLTMNNPENPNAAAAAVANDVSAQSKAETELEELSNMYTAITEILRSHHEFLEKIRFKHLECLNASTDPDTPKETTDRGTVIENLPIMTLFGQQLLKLSTEIQRPIITYAVVTISTALSTQTVVGPSTAPIDTERTAIVGQIVNRFISKAFRKASRTTTQQQTQHALQHWANSLSILGPVTFSHIGDASSLHRSHASSRSSNYSDRDDFEDTVSSGPANNSITPNTLQRDVEAAVLAASNASGYSFHTKSVMRVDGKRASGQSTDDDDFESVKDEEWGNVLQRPLVRLREYRTALEILWGYNGEGGCTGKDVGDQELEVDDRRIVLALLKFDSVVNAISDRLNINV